jgi:hypothetical protein
MTFLGRLKFYGFGFALGLCVLYAMFGTRSCVTPNEMKMQELVHQQFRLSEKARCKLNCLDKNEALLKLALRHFEVNYDLSSVHKTPCGEYYIQPKKEHADKQNFRLVILDCDTISQIDDISITSANSATCNCQ